MKITYEIVCIKGNKIFIIPNISEEKIINSRVTINFFYDDIHKNFGNKKIIFGIKKVKLGKRFSKLTKIEISEYEWKVVRSQKTGPFWGFEYFEDYKGKVPDKDEITGFPSSCLFDL